jgi:hypothetical protein
VGGGSSVLTTSGPSVRSTTEAEGGSSSPRRAGRVPRVARWRLGLLFVALLVAFAAGIWGTVLRPAAYEVRGRFVARPAVNLILVAHDAVPELGMRAMDLMTVFGEPEMLDAAGLAPGDRVRVAVRRRNDELLLLRIEKLPP